MYNLASDELLNIFLIKGKSFLAIYHISCDLTPGSTSVNVSATSSTGKSEYVNAGQIGNNSCSRRNPPRLTQIAVLALLLYIAMSFCSSSFL